MPIKDKVFAISGGSSGIGRALVTRASDGGAIVYSLDAKEPDNPVDGVNYLKCDITDEKQVKVALSKVEGEIDVLINNAGIMRRGTIFESTVDDYDALFSVNVKGSWLLVKSAEPKLKSDAVIVQISSRHGMNPKDEPGIYSITKKAVIGLAEVLKLTKPKYQVKIVCPGRTDTPLLRVGRSDREYEEARKIAGSPNILADRIFKLIESDDEYLLFDESAGEYVTE